MPKFFPEKKVKFDRHKHKINEWMTDGILNSITFRDDLYVQLMNTDPVDEHKYNTLKTNLHTYNLYLKETKRRAKLLHISRIFESSRGTLRKLGNR